MLKYLARLMRSDTVTLEQKLSIIEMALSQDTMFSDERLVSQFLYKAAINLEIPFDLKSRIAHKAE